MGSWSAGQGDASKGHVRHADLAQGLAMLHEVRTLFWGPGSLPATLNRAGGGVAVHDLTGMWT